MARIYDLFGEKSAREKLADHLYQCLPAISHSQIAERLAKRLQKEVKSWKVAQILWWIHRDPEVYGFDVPHAARGRITGKERFVAVRIERGRDRQLTAEQNIEISKGAVSTIRHSSSSIQHEANAIMYYSQYAPAAAQRHLRAIARKMKHLADEAGDVADLWADDNGTG